jgi:hypothetical protein
LHKKKKEALFSGVFLFWTITSLAHLSYFGASFIGGGFLAHIESKSLLWIIFGVEIISIFILSEGDASGFSYDIVITIFIYLFVHVTCIFYYFNNLYNNKLKI